MNHPPYAWEQMDGGLKWMLLFFRKTRNRGQKTAVKSRKMNPTERLFWRTRNWDQKDSRERKVSESHDMFWIWQEWAVAWRRVGGQSIMSSINLIWNGLTNITVKFNANWSSPVCLMRFRASLEIGIVVKMRVKLGAFDFVLREISRFLPFGEEFESTPCWIYWGLAC